MSAAVTAAASSTAALPKRASGMMGGNGAGDTPPKKVESVVKEALEPPSRPDIRVINTQRHQARAVANHQQAILEQKKESSYEERVLGSKILKICRARWTPEEARTDEIIPYDMYFDADHTLRRTKTPKVLVVLNCRWQAVGLAVMLKKIGCSPIVCCDGDVAFTKYLKRHSDEFHLCICDWERPAGIGGRELCIYDRDQGGTLPFLAQVPIYKSANDIRKSGATIVLRAPLAVHILTLKELLLPHADRFCYPSDLLSTPSNHPDLARVLLTIGKDRDFEAERMLQQAIEQLEQDQELSSFDRGMKMLEQILTMVKNRTGGGGVGGGGFGSGAGGGVAAEDYQNLAKAFKAAMVTFNMMKDDVYSKADELRLFREYRRRKEGGILSQHTAPSGSGGGQLSDSTIRGPGASLTGDPIESSIRADNGLVVSRQASFSNSAHHSTASKRLTQEYMDRHVDTSSNFQPNAYVDVDTLSKKDTTTLIKKFRGRINDLEMENELLIRELERFAYFKVEVEDNISSNGISVRFEEKSHHQTSARGGEVGIHRAGSMFGGSQGSPGRGAARTVSGISFGAVEATDEDGSSEDGGGGGDDAPFGEFASTIGRKKRKSKGAGRRRASLASQQINSMKSKNGGDKSDRIKAITRQSIANVSLLKKKVVGGKIRTFNPTRTGSGRDLRLGMISNNVSAKDLFHRYPEGVHRNYEEYARRLEEKLMMAEDTRGATGSVLRRVTPMPVPEKLTDIDARSPNAVEALQLAVTQYMTNVSNDVNRVAGRVLAISPASHAALEDLSLALRNSMKKVDMTKANADINTYVKQRVTAETTSLQDQIQFLKSTAETQKNKNPDVEARKKLVTLRQSFFLYQQRAARTLQNRTNLFTTLRFYFRWLSHLSNKRGTKSEQFIRNAVKREIFENKGTFIGQLSTELEENKVQVAGLMRNLQQEKAMRTTLEEHHTKLQQQHDAFKKAAANTHNSFRREASLDSRGHSRGDHNSSPVMGGSHLDDVKAMYTTGAVQKRPSNLHQAIKDEEVASPEPVKSSSRRMSMTNRNSASNSKLATSTSVSRGQNNRQPGGSKSPSAAAGKKTGSLSLSTSVAIKAQKSNSSPKSSGRVQKTLSKTSVTRSPRLSPRTSIVEGSPAPSSAFSASQRESLASHANVIDEDDAVGDSDDNVSTKSVVSRRSSVSAPTEAEIPTLPKPPQRTPPKSRSSVAIPDTTTNIAVTSNTSSTAAAVPKKVAHPISTILDSPPLDIDSVDTTQAQLSPLASQAPVVRKDTMTASQTAAQVAPQRAGGNKTSVTAVVVPSNDASHYSLEIDDVKMVDSPKACPLPTDEVPPLTVVVPTTSYQLAPATVTSNEPESDLHESTITPEIDADFIAGDDNPQKEATRSPLMGVNTQISPTSALKAASSIPEVLPPLQLGSDDNRVPSDTQINSESSSQHQLSIRRKKVQVQAPNSSLEQTTNVTFGNGDSGVDASELDPQECNDDLATPTKLGALNNHMPTPRGAATVIVSHIDRSSLRDSTVLVPDSRHRSMSSLHSSTNTAESSVDNSCAVPQLLTSPRKSTASSGGGDRVSSAGGRSPLEEDVPRPQEGRGSQTAYRMSFVAADEETGPLDNSAVVEDESGQDAFGSVNEARYSVRPDEDLEEEIMVVGKQVSSDSDDVEDVREVARDKPSSTSTTTLTPETTIVERISAVAPTTTTVGTSALEDRESVPVAVVSDEQQPQQPQYLRQVVVETEVAPMHQPVKHRTRPPLPTALLPEAFRVSQTPNTADDAAGEGYVAAMGEVMSAACQKRNAQIPIAERKRRGKEIACQTIISYRPPKKKKQQAHVGAGLNHAQTTTSDMMNEDAGVQATSNSDEDEETSPRPHRPTGQQNGSKTIGGTGGVFVSDKDFNTISTKQLSVNPAPASAFEFDELSRLTKPGQLVRRQPSNKAMSRSSSNKQLRRVASQNNRDEEDAGGYYVGEEDPSSGRRTAPPQDMLEDAALRHKQRRVESNVVSPQRGVSGAAAANADFLRGVLSGVGVGSIRPTQSNPAPAKVSARTIATNKANASGSYSSADYSRHISPSAQTNIAVAADKAVQSIQHSLARLKQTSGVEVPINVTLLRDLLDKTQGGGDAPSPEQRASFQLLSEMQRALHIAAVAATRGATQQQQHSYRQVTPPHGSSSSHSRLPHPASASGGSRDIIESAVPETELYKYQLDPNYVATMDPKSVYFRHSGISPLRQGRPLRRIIGGGSGRGGVPLSSVGAATAVYTNAFYIHTMNRPTKMQFASQIQPTIFSSRYRDGDRYVSPIQRTSPLGGGMAFAGQRRSVSPRATVLDGHQAPGTTFSSQRRNQSTNSHRSPHRQQAGGSPDHLMRKRRYTPPRYTYPGLLPDMQMGYHMDKAAEPSSPAAVINTTENTTSTRSAIAGGGVSGGWQGSEGTGTGLAKAIAPLMTTPRVPKGQPSATYLRARPAQPELIIASTDRSVQRIVQARKQQSASRTTHQQQGDEPPAPTLPQISRSELSPSTTTAPTRPTVPTTPRLPHLAASARGAPRQVPRTQAEKKAFTARSLDNFKELAQ